MLAEFYETFFVIRDGKVFRFRNDLYRLFVALYLFYEQFKAFVVALFISPIERSEKLEVIEILSARKKRIIHFPAVASPYGQNKKIIPLGVCEIAENMLVIDGIIGRIEKILFFPPAAILLSHEFKGKIKPELGQIVARSSQ